MARTPNKTPSKTSNTAAAAPLNDDVRPTIDDDIEVAETEQAEGALEAGAGEGEHTPSPSIVPQQGDPGRDDITKQYRAMRDAEKAAAAGDGDGSAAEAEADEQPGGGTGGLKTPAATEAAAAGEAGEPGTEPEEPMVTLLVDGKQVQKKQSEVIALAQITVAGDNRLEEAKRLLSEAKTLRANPEHQREAAPEGASRTDESQAGTQPEHPPAKRTIDPKKLTSVVERIQIGDAEDGAKALAELVEELNSGTAAAEQVTPEQIAQAVNQHLFQRETQQETDKALADFSVRYKPILEDPDYKGVALTKLHYELRSDLKKAGLSDQDLAPIDNNLPALAAAHRHARTSGHKLRTYGELLTSVGDGICAKFGIKPVSSDQDAGTPARQHPRTAASSDAAMRRIEAKRAAPQQPRAAGVRVPAPQAPKPLSTAETIQRMRESRGFQRTA